MHIKISICTNATFFSSVLPTLCCSFFLLTAYCMSDMWWWQNGWVLLLPWCMNIVQDVGDHSYCEWEKYLMWRNKEKKKTTFWHRQLDLFFSPLSLWLSQFGRNGMALCLMCLWLMCLVSYYKAAMPAVYLLNLPFYVNYV